MLFMMNYVTGVKKTHLLVIMLIAGYVVYRFTGNGISFFISRLFSTGFDGRNLNLYNTVKDISQIPQLLIFLTIAFLVYRWNWINKSYQSQENIQQLQQSLADAERKLLEVKNVNDKMTIKNGDRTVLVPFNEIACFLADGPYVKVITVSRVHLLKKTLQDLEKLLPGMFLRVHRSHIVNTGFIRESKSLQNGDHLLFLSNNTEVRVSRTYASQFKAAMEISTRAIS